MNIAATFKSHLIEFIAAFALIGIGIVCTAISADKDHPSVLLAVCGGIATAIGTALITWILGQALSRKDALNEVNTELDLISRNIGQASAQIGSTVARCAEGKLHHSTGFELVKQNTTAIYAQVNAIQSIIGDPFSVQDLIDITLPELRKLAVELQEVTSSEDATRIAATIDKVLVNLESKSTARLTNVATNSTCPHCGSTAVSSLGQEQGSTARTKCPHCGKSFNTHRAGDGSVFSRALFAPSSPSAPDKVPGPVTTEELDITCPDCSAQLEFTRRSGSTQDPICLNCGAVLRLSSEGQAETRGDRFEILEGSVVGRFGSGGSGAAPVVECAKCNQELRCIVKREGYRFAIDAPCKRLHRVANDKFVTWRQINEPDTMTHL